MNLPRRRGDAPVRDTCCYSTMLPAGNSSEVDFGASAAVSTVFLDERKSSSCSCFSSSGRLPFPPSFRLLSHTENSSRAFGNFFVCQRFIALVFSLFFLFLYFRWQCAALFLITSQACERNASEQPALSGTPWRLGTGYFAFCISCKWNLTFA